MRNLNKCENCYVDIDGTFGSGRFCGKKCASTRYHSEETKHKIRNTLIKTLAKNKKEIFCKSCETKMEYKKTYCGECKQYIGYKQLFEKLNIFEKNVQIANKLAVNKIINLYYKQCLSTINLRNDYKINDNTLNKFCKLNNIKLRTHSQAQNMALLHNRSTPSSNPTYHNGYHITWYGKTVYLRSSYEFNFAQQLDDLQIYYEVEEKRFEYEIDGETHIYIPDFYIPSLNMIVETKNEYFYKRDRKIIDKKIERVKEHGYNFVLLLNEEQINNCIRNSIG